MSVGRRNLQEVLGPSVSDLVAKDHPYRLLLGIVPFDELCIPLNSLYSKRGRSGFAPSTMFKVLTLQWMEDLSDREAERFLQENLAGKLLCGFTLTDQTPDYSTICLFRNRVGTKVLAELFERLGVSLEQAGLVRGVFTFVDATHLISKSNLWKERDATILKGQQKLSNANVSQVAVDKQARFGRKGNLKWFGFKIHAGVDMSNGLIRRVGLTPANVEDTRAVCLVLPETGMVFGDKAYGVGASAKQMEARDLHNGAILKNDMKAKNHEKDAWLSSVRTPFESTFSQFEKRARYRGIQKCRFQAMMQSIAHNFKRLIVIQAPPLVLRPHCV